LVVLALGLAGGVAATGVWVTEVFWTVGASHRRRHWCHVSRHWASALPARWQVRCPSSQLSRQVAAAATEPDITNAAVIPAA